DEPAHRDGPRLFFFQAEDGIRDFHVTGVQTCALPILGGRVITRMLPARTFLNRPSRKPPCRRTTGCLSCSIAGALRREAVAAARSEERRVGKECRSQGAPWR